MFNFASGPGMLPEEVLEQARSELCDWRGTGMSVLEMPFTSGEFKSIAGRARNDLQTLLRLPENYRILFMQGGAYAHFALLAMNLMGKKACADYVQTGHWSNRAINEARRYGPVNIAASSKATGFDCIPAQSDWRLNPAATYCHITTNETANGVQFHWTPDTDAVPLVADVTSDFLAREIDISRYGMVYASAQKNVGPAGLTLVIIREDAWILRQGGVAILESVNRQKSKKLYALIDQDDFYFCPVAEADRSMVNVCFYLRDAALETLFLEKAKQAGLINLNGHGAAGGIRASLYNAMPVAGVDALIGFMQSFADTCRSREARTTGTTYK
jgi:phosphoserine aminotransferase